MALYGPERLSLIGGLLKKNYDISNGRPWALEPRELRFKHGETIAELKVPYHMGGEDERTVEDALLSLGSLLLKRFEPKMEGGKDAAALVIPVGVLKDKTFRTDLFISDSIEKEIAVQALSGSPCMDTAILANWLGSDGHGRRLIRWVQAFMEKMTREEAKSGTERTAYLSFLAVTNTVRKKKERLKGIRIKGLPYERADLAVGLTLFFTIRTALADFFKKLKESGASSHNPGTEAAIMSALTPRSFLSIQDSILSSSLNPYAMNSDTYASIQRASGFEGLDWRDIRATELAAAVRKDPGALEAIKVQSDINRFRSCALSYLTGFDIPGGDINSLLFELYNEDRFIRNFLSDQKAMGALSSALEEDRKRFAKDQKRGEAVDSFLKFLSGFRKSMFGLKKAKKADEAAHAIESFCACGLDGHIERYVSLMRGYLADRRGEFKENLLVEEYKRGRLYRFSVDDRPVLKTLELEEEGQLFIDMKDFTRKTLKVKEIAMADFMREHFYKPILNAAGRYMGAGMGSDEKDIRLTNIPGDAAIFSGGVANLVALAKDIQHIIRRYREELTKRLPPRKDDEILEEVHTRFASRKDALKQKRAELNESLAANEPGAESRLVALGEEEHRLENNYRDELEAAIKGELEAGLYISFGSKAETMVIEPKGEASEPVSVSIGEKINEASRGTFRNPLVRAKLEMLLENEKKLRKDKSLKYPFDIYIDRVISIKFPPELDSSFEKLLSSRKTVNAKAMSQVIANEFLNDINRILSGDPFSELRVISSTTDIYNKGEALSLNALEAYMKETKGSKWFFQKTVRADELDRAILDAFFLPADPLEFWFSYEARKGADRTEVFYRSGEIIFKGFEASTPMPVYELINPEGEFCKALMKCHFSKWLEDSRSSAPSFGF